MTDERTAKLINDEEFRDNILLKYFSKLWFEEVSNIRFNRTIVFMTNDSLTHYNSSLEKDFEYIRKLFVRESDLLKIIERQEQLHQNTTKTPFKYNKQTLELLRLNILYGMNGSGKTRMLREMSNQFEVPIVNDEIDVYKPDVKEILSHCEPSKLINDYKRLWGYSLKANELFSQPSDSQTKLLLYAARIGVLEQSKGIILLDDIGWNGYDSARTLNFIEYLVDLSLTENLVVCATTNDNVKKLLLKKSISPNLIDLNK